MPAGERAVPRVVGCVVVVEVFVARRVVVLAILFRGLGGDCIDSWLVRAWHELVGPGGPVLVGRAVVVRICLLLEVGFQVVGLVVVIRVFLQ